MSAALARGRAASIRPPRLWHGLRWHELLLHGPAHVVMVGAMVLAMLPGAGIRGHLAAGLALVATALVLAPLARSRPQLRTVLLDLGAMTAVLIGVVVGPAGPGHDHGELPSASVISGAGGIESSGAVAIVGLVSALWLLGRLRLERTRLALVTGAITGAGLLVMALAALS